MSKIAFLYPGQGSQYVGMGKSLYNDFSLVKDIFEEANDVLKFDLKKLCFEGSVEELTKTQNTQPALLTVSVAAFKVFIREIGIKPQFLAGHSLGEYSALVCSGMIRFGDALRIVKKRGELMQEAVLGENGIMMAAVSGINVKELSKQCEDITTLAEPVVIACYNSLKQNVVSGHPSSMVRLIERLEKINARVTPLNVSAPFHSPMMAQAAKKLANELKKYEYGTPEWNVISNVTAQPYLNKSEIINKLMLQMTQPVRWMESMHYLNEQGVENAIELGPKTVLKNLLKVNVEQMQGYCLGESSDLCVLKDALIKNKEESSRAAKKSKAMDIISKCIVTAISTKNRNWDNDEYQKCVIDPYRKVKTMYETLAAEGKEPTTSQVCEALEMLRIVLVTKKVSKSYLTDVMKNTADGWEYNVSDVLIESK